MAPAPGVLDGIVIADFSRVLAGPLATMFLADLGATVIKVERPGTGDDTRWWGPPHVGSMSTYYTSVNRNKRSIALDLSDADDLALAHQLANRADVLIENFLPGKLSHFGLDADSLELTNPGLVYCSISGFGTGQGAHLLGYDFVVQAVGGLMSITGQEDGEPTKVGVAVVDVLTGLHATVAILAALRARDTDGLGQLVEVNLLSSLLASLVNQGAASINGGPAPSLMGNEHPSIAPYETLTTKSGRIAVAVGNDRQFGRFVATIGLPTLIDDVRFASNSSRVSYRRELVAELEAALAVADADEWTRRLQAQSIPCGQVNTIREGVQLGVDLGLEPVIHFDPVDDEPAIATLASPLKLARNPVRYSRRPPALGADTDEVREWLLSPDAGDLT